MASKKQTAAERWREVPATWRREVLEALRCCAAEDEAIACDPRNRGTRAEDLRDEAQARRAAIAVLREAGRKAKR